MADAPHHKTPSMSLQNRTIRIGDTTIEVTEREVWLRVVEYLYKPAPDAEMIRRMASVEEVLQANYPEDMFQVTASGYEDMKAKAKRILALWQGEKFQ